MVQRGDLSSLRREEIAVMLGNLLSIRFDNGWDTRLKHASREQIRHQTFTALYDFIVALAKQQPLALIFEDLHWADDLSLDLLSLLLEAVPTQPLLLLLVYRPEPHHKSERLGRLATQKYAQHYRELRLHELPDPTSRQLLDSLLVVDNLPATLKARILERSRGNPFFVEETLRSLIEAGAIQKVAGRWKVLAEIEDLTVPESVQSVILSRVDRLSPELKQLLQYAAVIGRLFRLEIIARVMPPTLDLEEALWTLEETTLIYPERVLPQPEYSFKHALPRSAV
jgi:adenylate cyclase